MHKCLAIIMFCLTIFIPFLPTGASESGVVINSFQISSENGSNDEYVEIYNTTDVERDISGWRLAKKSASASASPIYLRYEIPAGTILGTGKKIKIAHPDFAGKAEVTYANSVGNAPSGVAANNTILLLSDTKAVIDRVGFGTAADFEGNPIVASPETGEIYSRRGSGQDTDNNKNDFYLSYKPPVEEEPEEESIKKESASEEFPEATVGAKLRVSEFVINPEGSDTEGEWIEIYNDGGDANISGYAIADRLGSPKKYSFPKGTKIKKGQYLAFYSGQTPISLNNDGDAVELRSPDGQIIHYSENSGKGAEGLSFAWSGSKWSWTKKPTPGATNIIEAPTKEELSGDKNGSKTEVLSLVDESQLPTELDEAKSAAARKNDQLLGYGLIVLAFLGGISYTLYINKERLREFYFHKIRKRDHLSGREIWAKIKRWRGLSSNR